MESEKPEVGDFVTVPAVRTGRPRANPYGIDDMAIKAKERPGQALLALSEIPEREAYRIRSNAVGKPYIDEHGEVKVSRRTVKKTEAGRFCDVYLTYYPFTDVTTGD